MIQHILMWNYKEGVSGEERARIEKELGGLARKVPALRGLRWGPVVGGRNQSFSHCFVMLFDSEEGLAEYAAHPEHIRFAGPFREACETQVVVDFKERYTSNVVA